MNRLNSIKLMLIIDQPFFGYLLMHVPFKCDNSIENIGTDGEKIYYNESFVEEANDEELKFLIMHQIAHMILNHIIRSLDYSDKATFGKAADLVVNSIVSQALSGYQLNSINKFSITHMINGVEAGTWTVDQVYEKIKKNESELGDINGNDDGNTIYFGEGDFLCDEGSSSANLDDHFMWENIKSKSKFEQGQMSNKWALGLKDAAEFASNKSGGTPGYLSRIIQYMERYKVNWKDALRNFIETEVTDYSFNPPDKRYSGENYLLPDYNETEDKVTGIFFFIDVSGSMNDEQIAECKAELRSCIKQYNGKVEGYLGYFDYEVSDIQRFDDEDSMEGIECLGGGGTSFENIFKYLDVHADEFDVENKKVIIMTDGYAPFPDESSLNVDELLWIINNNDVTPPYGEVVRI